ncbi:hypothetical protein SB758_41750, partial [Burkholderia sp. SIMBA_013]
VGILLFACGVSLVSGPTGVGISELWAYLTGGAAELDARDKVILEAVRLPRTALGMLIASGAGIFRPRDTMKRLADDTSA